MIDNVTSNPLSCPDYLKLLLAKCSHQCRSPNCPDAGGTFNWPGEAGVVSQKASCQG